MAAKPQPGPEKAEYFSAHVDASGRLLIPVVLRRRLGLTPGAGVTMRLTPGTDGLCLTSRQASRRAAQALVSNWRGDGGFWSDELIAERHAATEREAARAPFSRRPPVAPTPRRQRLGGPGGRAAAEIRLAATRARSAQGASKLPRYGRPSRLRAR